MKIKLYPIFGFFISIATLIFSLLMAKNLHLYYFYIAIAILYLCFGYYKALLKAIPFSIVLIALFASLTYLVSSNNEATIYAINRAIACSLALLPGFLISSNDMVKNLESIKAPKAITLGMMITLNFFPLLKIEMNRIKEAMKTRGACFVFNPKIFYRAFLIPLIVRIVNISDTLTMSVETRGFTFDKTKTTIYNPIKIRVKDIIFILLFVSITVVGGVGLCQGWF